MKKSISYKSKAHRFTLAVMMSLALLLLAGCGNGNTQDKNSSQENQTSGEQNQTAGQQEQNAGEQDQPNSQQDQMSEEQNQAQGGQDQNTGEQSQPQEGQTEQQTQAGSQGNSVNQPEIGMEEAKEAALQHAGLTAAEVTFVKEELDYEHGKTEYDIEFVSGATRYKYEISADDGAVLESSQEAIQQVPENIQGVISVEEAKTAVLNHAGFTADQVAYTKIELEQEHGGAEYEIDFYADGKEYSSKVDAVTGAILEYEMD